MSWTFLPPYCGIGFTHTGRYNPKIKQAYKWINNLQLQRVAFMMQQSLATVHLAMTKQNKLTIKIPIGQC